MAVEWQDVVARRQLRAREFSEQVYHRALDGEGEVARAPALFPPLNTLASSRKPRLPLQLEAHPQVRDAGRRFGARFLAPLGLARSELAREFLERDVQQDPRLAPPVGQIGFSKHQNVNHFTAAYYRAMGTSGSRASHLPASTDP